MTSKRERHIKKLRTSQREVLQEINKQFFNEPGGKHDPRWRKINRLFIKEEDHD